MRITLSDLPRTELLARHTYLAQQVPHATDMSIGIVTQPQHSGRVEQLHTHLGKKLLPHRKRTPGPIGVELVRTIAHADNAGLTAGAGPAIPRAVGVDQH